jgi:hypothetical protein
MRRISELAVTLSADLYDHLVAEARQLDVPLEWVVASLAVDTFGEEGLAVQGCALQWPAPRAATSSSPARKTAKATEVRSLKTVAIRQARA